MSVAALARARATVRIARTTTAGARISTALTTEARLAGATAGVVGGAADAGATVAAPTAAVTSRNTADTGVGGVVAVVRAALGVVHASAVVCSTRNALATRTFLPRRTGRDTGAACCIAM